MGFWSDLFGGGKNKEAKQEPASQAPGTEPPAAKAEAPPAPPPPAPPKQKPQPKQETRKQQEEDEDMEGVQRLLSRKVERVLEQLGALAARARTGEEVPSMTVTLHLAHGHSMTGEVVDYVPRESVLLALGKEGLLRSASVAYVDVATVVAVSVGNADPLLELPQLVRPNPTRQDLVSLLEKVPHAITEQFWPGEASLGGRPLRFEVDWVGMDDEPGRRALETAVNVAGHALRSLAQEQGREVLRRILTVRFIKGRDTRVSMEGDTGTVTVAPGTGDPTVSAFRKAFAAGIR
ncbi:hypothetical protein [Myxococcus sp. RHSTA-1-4]|uniref:hypothetical protein n=1 Tax=Myxococcus sp. RHSTA-1-4 TaxID=2874601 RepID=UPI001CC1779B|nr:hypothetical protein [Myxococcus sp. RHSTA-1-4]MBZ4415181.1 hypothetical protein [Myxococcus sp. RHSTA-1-4]